MVQSGARYQLLRSPLNNLKAEFSGACLCSVPGGGCIIIWYEVREHNTAQYASINSENRSHFHVHC